MMTLTFYFLPKKLGTIELVVNHELKLLSQWLRSNKLCLNEIKTELIIFRYPRKNLPREPDTRINNYKLKFHSHVKYHVNYSYTSQQSVILDKTH